jgi:hypothetical protein
MLVSGMNIFSFKLSTLVSIVTFYVKRQFCGCSRPTLHSICQPNFSKAETTTGGLFILSVSTTAVTGCSANAGFLQVKAGFLSDTIKRTLCLVY